jgi:hypothetical protein
MNREAQKREQRWKRLSPVSYHTSGIPYRVAPAWSRVKRSRIGSGQRLERVQGDR